MARILVNHSARMPDQITGTSVYTWCLLEALCLTGRHDYVLVSNWSAERIPAAVRAGCADVVLRKTPRNETLAILDSTLNLPALMKRHACDLVFHPQPDAMLTGQDRSVVVLHDLYRVTHQELFGWAKRAQWQYVVTPSFRRATHLIAVSAATRDAALAAYPDLSGRISVVHEASPIAAPAEPPPPPFKNGRPYLLMVANMTPNKNVELVLKALSRLAGKGLRPRFCLVGRDEYGVLPGLLAQSPGVDLELAGTVSPERLAALYAHAHAYVNASRTEGFCLPILEAHTFATPVVCSDLPVLREVAGEGALFFDPTDAASLEAALTRILTEPGLHERLARGATANAARFSWEKAAAETEAVFDAVLQKHGARAAA